MSTRKNSLRAFRQAWSSFAFKLVLSTMFAAIDLVGQIDRRSMLAVLPNDDELWIAHLLLGEKL